MNDPWIIYDDGLDAHIVCGNVEIGCITDLPPSSRVTMGQAICDAHNAALARPAEVSHPAPDIERLISTYGYANRSADADRIAAAYKALVDAIGVSQGAVAGWKLVPEEPTEEMGEAYLKAARLHAADEIERLRAVLADRERSGAHGLSTSAVVNHESENLNDNDRERSAGRELTDERLQELWSEACEGTPGWSRHIRFARALLARRAESVRDGAQRLQSAADGVVNHWREFGPAHGLDEAVDQLDRAIRSLKGTRP